MNLNISFLPIHSAVFSLSTTEKPIRTMFSRFALFLLTYFIVIGLCTEEKSKPECAAEMKFDEPKTACVIVYQPKDAILNGTMQLKFREYFGERPSRLEKVFQKFDYYFWSDNLTMGDQSILEKVSCDSMQNVLYLNVPNQYPTFSEWFVLCFSHHFFFFFFCKF